MSNMEDLMISLLLLIFKNSLTILDSLLFHVKFRINIFSSENPAWALLKGGIALSALNGTDYLMES